MGRDRPRISVCVVLLILPSLVWRQLCCGFAGAGKGPYANLLDHLSDPFNNNILSNFSGFPGFHS